MRTTKKINSRPCFRSIRMHTNKTNLFYMPAQLNYLHFGVTIKAHLLFFSSVTSRLHVTLITRKSETKYVTGSCDEAAESLICVIVTRVDKKFRVVHVIV